MGGKRLKPEELERVAMALDIHEAAQDLVALRLLLACLLRRLPRRITTITHAEVAAALADRGCSLERWTDPETGELMVRLAGADEEPPEAPPTSKILGPEGKPCDAGTSKSSRTKRVRGGST
jgi:hypothetical protein